MIADSRAWAIAFALAPGQARELPMARGLLDRLPEVPGWVVGDCARASDSLHERIRDRGARPVLPPRRTDAPVSCPGWIYTNRCLVENLVPLERRVRPRHPLREGRGLLPWRALPRCNTRLAQVHKSNRPRNVSCGQLSFRPGTESSDDASAMIGILLSVG